MVETAMQPTYDNRGRMQNRAGIHALFVGVGSYQDLRIRKLTSPSVSAYRIYKWLIEARGRLALPLVSSRLLLSPTLSERRLARELGGLPNVPRSRLEQLREALVGWREDAMQCNESMTLFYFAGHGLELDRKAAVLLEDSELLRAIDIESIIHVMNPPSVGSMARTQLYFFDCCRDPSLSISVGRMSPHPELGPPPDRYLFFATSSGTKAYGKNGKTRFSEALLESLKGDAADARMVDGVVRVCVTTESLWQSLWRKVPDTLAEPFRNDPVNLRPRQQPEARMNSRGAIISFLD
jgi:hypothetical protein